MALPTIQTTLAYLTALIFTLAALVRLTSRISPSTTAYQRSKTAPGFNADVWVFSGGIANLVVAFGLLWPATRRVAAGMGIAYLGLGLYGRVKTGKTWWPPLAMAGLLLGVVAG